MRQQTLYAPTKLWLESKGFRVMVTGAKRNFVIPVSDLFAGGYKVPDLVGVDKSGRVMIAEVEKDKDNFFDALGRCLLWKCTATFVYLVFPSGVIGHAPLLKRLGVGLLEVDEESQAVTELVGLPENDRDLWWVWELHPIDPTKEQQLSSFIRNSFG
jgi:hypothetical protein